MKGRAALAKLSEGNNIENRRRTGESNREKIPSGGTRLLSIKLEGPLSEIIDAESFLRCLMDDEKEGRRFFSESEDQDNDSFFLALFTSLLSLPASSSTSILGILSLILKLQ